MGKVFKMLWNALREGSPRTPKGWLAKYVTVLSIIVAVFEIYLNITGTLEPYLHATLFMAVMVALAFILRSPSKKTKTISWVDVGFSLSMICFTIYIVLNRERILTRFALVDELTIGDIVFGVIGVVAILEITRRILGIGMMLPVIAILLYVFIGHMIEGSFYQR